nr:hypothetical protein [Tanacetum cinerariifolium]
MGKVKEISSLSNLKMVLATEGFDNTELKYMGGYWQASNEFTIDRRVTWVEIEGVPLKMWSENTFTRIASKWGFLLHVDDQEERCFHRKRVCIHTNILTNIFESSKIIYRGRRFKRSRCGIEKCLFLGGDNDVEEVSETKFEEEMHNSKLEGISGGQKSSRSEDPFNIYELLNKKQGDINKDSCVDDSLKYPPGFTPTNAIGEHSNKGDESKKEGGEYYQYTQEEEVLGGVKENCSNKSSNEDVAESVCSGHFKKGLKEELAELDAVIDKGNGNVEVVNKRMNVVKSLQELEKLQSLEAAQNAKIKWETEGDENSKYYHGILNKKNESTEYSRHFGRRCGDFLLKVQRYGRGLSKRFMEMMEKLEDVWRGDVALKHMYPKFYALDSCKNVDVATKLSHSSLDYRVPRGGVEQT